MEVVKLAIENIKPYVKNAKKHPKKQVEQIANSIKEFGFNQPIVVDKDNIVIVGHGRFEGAKLLNLKEVPVLKVDLTEEQAKAYRLADNKLNESEWDMELVMEDLKELQLKEFDIELTGFSIDLIAEPNEKDDEVPEVPKEAVSQLGDIYQLGEHRLMCGDSTKLEDVERLMDGQKAHMVFTDPPYGYYYEINQQSKYEKLKNDDKILDFFTTAWSVMGENSVIYTFCGFQTVEKWKPLFEKYFKLKNIVVWEKNNWSMGDLTGAFAGKYEMILFGHKGISKMIGARDTDIWRFDREPPKSHPTMKPVDLIVYALSKFQSGKVLDLFGGSGSTLVACEKTNRKCYMMELDPKYIDVIIKRWEDYTNKKAIKLN